ASPSRDQIPVLVAFLACRPRDARWCIVMQFASRVNGRGHCGVCDTSLTYPPSVIDYGTSEAVDSPKSAVPIPTPPRGIHGLLGRLRSPWAGLLGRKSRPLQ